MAKILIVDDSSFQRRLIRGLLTRLGHDVVEADNGENGLSALDADSPDLLLVDLLMPGMTGFDVLARLQDRRAALPRLVLTADVQDSARQRCLELGASEVLNKPPKEWELRDAIANALSGAE